MFPLSEIQDSGTYKEVGCINDKQNDDSQHSKTAGHHGFGPMFWALTLGGQPSDGPRAADRGIPRFDWHEAGCVRQSWLRRTYGH